MVVVVVVVMVVEGVGVEEVEAGDHVEQFQKGKWMEGKSMFYKDRKLKVEMVEDYQEEMLAVVVVGVFGVEELVQGFPVDPESSPR